MEGKYYYFNGDIKFEGEYSDYGIYGDILKDKIKWKGKGDFSKDTILKDTMFDANLIQRCIIMVL